MPILPAIGNNDAYYHDDAPNIDQDFYYSDLWKVFFEEVPANAELANDQAIK